MKIYCRAQGNYGAHEILRVKTWCQKSAKNEQKTAKNDMH